MNQCEHKDVEIKTSWLGIVLDSAICKKCGEDVSEELVNQHLNAASL